MKLRDLFIKIGIDADEKKLQSIDGALGTIKKTALAVGAAIGAAGLAVAYFGKKAGDLEQVNIAFETMLGSAEKASDLMNELKAFTLKTPFEFMQTVQGAKALLAYNIEAEKVVQTLENLGNIAAGVGREKLPALILAFGQVRTATKLRGQELRQFTEAGVPLISGLAKLLGKDEKAIPEMMQKSLITFEMVEKVISRMTTGDGKFADLMIKQSKSYLGLLSIIRDNLNFIAMNVGTELLPILKEFASKFIKVLKDNKELIQETLVKFFKGLLNFVRDFISYMGGLEKMFKMFAKIALILGVGGILTIIGKLTIAVTALATSFKLLNLQFLKFAGIGALVAGTFLLLHDLIASLDKNFKGPTIFKKLNSMLQGATGIDAIGSLQGLAGFMKSGVVGDMYKGGLAVANPLLKNYMFPHMRGASGSWSEKTPGATGGWGSQTINNDVKINIDGSKSPKETAMEARKALENIIKDTSSNTKTKVVQ